MSSQQTVKFNHAYLVLSPHDYKAITESHFLRNEFSAVELRETQTENGDHWSGFYIRGENTYFEFFQPQEGFNLQKVGNIGLAFGTDALNDLDSLEKFFHSRAINYFKRMTREKIVNDNPVPWFDCLFFDHSDLTPAQLNYWIMAYQPDFFGLDQNTQTITRKMANSARYDETKLLKDIIEMDFLLEVDSYNRLANLLRMTNYIESEISKNCIRFTDGNIIYSLRIRDNPDHLGITRMKMLLNRLPKNIETQYLGHIALSFDANNMVCNMQFN